MDFGLEPESETGTATRGTQDSVGMEMANSKYSVPIKKIAMSGLVVTVHMQNWEPQKCE